MRDRRGISYYQASKKPLVNYEKFLKFQNTLPTEPLEPYSSWALLWKEKKQNLQLYGTRCRKCGTFAFPRRRVCLHCSAKDEFEDAKLPRRGKIYTFAKDFLYPNPDPPTVMAVADMEGGGRFYGQVTDCDPGPDQDRHAPGTHLPSVPSGRRVLQLFLEAPSNGIRYSPQKHREPRVKK